MVAPSTARQHWPGRRTFVAGLALFVLFAVYGSLVPFDITFVPLDEAVRRFVAAMSLPLQLWSRSDLIANVLLMVPVAFSLMAIARLDRRGFGGALVAGLASIAFGALLANTLEFLQVFTPDRVVSKTDVIAQTLGATVGVATWGLAGQAMVDWLRGFGDSGLDTRLRRIQGLFALYAIGWFVMMALPLELSLSPVAWLHKYREGGIVLVPFAAHYDSRADMIWDVVGSMLSAVPLGALAWLTALHHRWQHPWRRATLLGAAFVVAGEFVQVLEAHRVADVTDVMFGTIGAVAGVWLAARRVPMDAKAASDAHVESHASGRSRVALGETLAWCAVLVFYHWKPFAFTTDTQLIRARLAGVSLMPLAQYVHSSTGPQLLLQMLIKAGLGLPLGVTLARWARTWSLGRTPSSTRLRWAICLLFSLGILGVIETGQIFLPDRVADITDVLVGWTGAVGGLALVLHGPMAQRIDETGGPGREHAPAH
jgi:glycopeptide antibiotics resistance protein